MSELSKKKVLKNIDCLINNLSSVIIKKNLQCYNGFLSLNLKKNKEKDKSRLEYLNYVKNNIIEKYPEEKTRSFTTNLENNFMGQRNHLIICEILHCYLFAVENINKTIVEQFHNILDYIIGMHDFLVCDGIKTIDKIETIFSKGKNNAS